MFYPIIQKIFLKIFSKRPAVSCLVLLFKWMFFMSNTIIFFKIFERFDSTRKAYLNKCTEHETDDIFEKNIQRWL